MRWVQAVPGDPVPDLAHLHSAELTLGGAVYEIRRPRDGAVGVWVRTPEGTWWRGEPSSAFDRMLLAAALRAPVVLQEDA